MEHNTSIIEIPEEILEQIEACGCGCAGKAGAGSGAQVQ